MNRFVTMSCVLLMIGMSIRVDGQDAIQEELGKAKKTYQMEKDAYKESVLEALGKREEATRKAGDKKLVDLAKSEREAFENWNAIPNTVPVAVSKRRASSRTRMEAAFNTAIKSYVRTKNDAAAAALEKELQAFRGDDWPQLNLESVKFKGDVFQVGTRTTVSTTQEFSGPVEINVTARTEKDNIRLHAIRGASVIFNWEVNPSELRVTRPDGQDRPQSGSLATANVSPLKPGTWYKLRWRIIEGGMQIFVNDQVVFSEKKAYDLTSKSRISIETVTSVVEVRDFHVVPVTKE